MSPRIPTPVASTASFRPRHGHTVLELTLGLVLTLMIFGMTIPFVRMQSRSVKTNAGRADAQQTARYAQNLIDRELRNVGIGVQPAELGKVAQNEQRVKAQREHFRTRLEPNGISKVVSYVRIVENSLGDGVKRVVEREHEVIKKLRRVRAAA